MGKTAPAWHCAAQPCAAINIVIAAGPIDSRFSKQCLARKFDGYANKNDYVNRPDVGNQYHY